MNCQLKSLLSARLQNSLPFLSLSEGLLTSQQKGLACCDGKGFRISDDGVVSGCEVKQRLHAVQKILFEFRKRLGYAFEAYEFQTRDFQVCWNWLILYKHRRVIKGFLIDCNSDQERKFLASSLALMTIWRLGLKTYLFNLQQQDISEFIRFIESHKGDANPPIVFLEIEQGLWGIQKKENITYIISWCEKHLWPLWIINKEQVPKEPMTENKAMQMFQKRISKRKQKSFFSWLDKETLSKLSTLCTKFPR